MVIALCAASRTSHAEEPSKVLAKVNGVPITFRAVEAEIDTIIAQTLYHRDVTPEKRETLKKEALERLIVKELEYEEAIKQGIKAGREEIQERVEEIKKKVPSEKEFRAILKKNNLTMKKYEELVGKELIIAKIYNAEVENEIRIGDDDMKTYYENNMGMYREPEKIRLRHIVIMFDPAKGEADKEKARVKAEELLKRVKSGEDFAALASEFSEDSYKARGGELGYLSRGMMEPEMEKAAFSLQVGEIMGPVETEYGFYIIKIEDKQPERQLAFDEVKERVKKEVERKKREERKAEWIDSLKAKAKIEYY